jgi:rhodanese-related sulfurtransferase
MVLFGLVLAVSLATAACAAPRADPALGVVNQTLAELPDGFLNLTPTELNDQLASGTPPAVVDVRERSEIERDGYIAGAVSVPLRTLAKQLGSLPSDPAMPLVVYCGSGQRSPMAVFALRALGFSQVMNLQGGFANWKRAGLPVDTNASNLKVPASPLVATGVDQAVLQRIDSVFSELPGDFGLVQAQQLNDELNSNTAPVLIDVRQPVETSASMLPGATPMPLRILLQDPSRLPSDKAADVVVYCGSGHRSAMGMIALRMAGYSHVRSLAGGTAAWEGTGLELGPGCGCTAQI